LDELEGAEEEDEEEGEEAEESVLFHHIQRYLG
jgi:hypothetical protein